MAFTTNDRGNDTWKGGDCSLWQAKYRLEVGSYSGTAGDSLALHKNRAFTTKDRDNDIWSRGHCSLLSGGAWWFGNCHHSNLNGKYLGEKVDVKGHVALFQE